MENVINEVRAERQRQTEKWGVQDWTPFVWLAILGEEVGEANKAAVETLEFKETIDGHTGVPSYIFAMWPEYRTELIQVAAVAIQAAECLDRQLKVMEGQGNG